MSELKLSELITYVKQELFRSAISSQEPLFFVDSVTLELNVTFSLNKSGGLDISVMNLFSLEGKVSGNSQNSNKITITLVPILSKEEQRKLIDEDKEMLERVKHLTKKALRKSINLIGESE